MKHKKATRGKARLDPMVRCDSCRYWEENGEEDGGAIGICFRFPPVLTDKDCGGAREWNHPMTYDDSFCGEHSAGSFGTANVLGEGRT